MPNEEEKKIAKELIEEIKAESLAAPNEVLCKLSVDEPSVLTAQDRINELEKYLKGEESKHAEMEIEAEKLYQQEEGK